MKNIPKNKSKNNPSIKRSLALMVAAFGFLLYFQTIGYSFVMDDASQ